jgi:hypothetical protein
MPRRCTLHGRRALGCCCKWPLQLPKPWSFATQRVHAGDAQGRQWTGCHSGTASQPPGALPQAMGHSMSQRAPASLSSPMRCRAAIDSFTAQTHLRDANGAVRNKEILCGSPTRSLPVSVATVSSPFAMAARVMTRAQMGTGMRPLQSSSRPVFGSPARCAMRRCAWCATVPGLEQRRVARRWQVLASAC